MGYLGEIWHWAFQKGEIAGEDSRVGIQEEDEERAWQTNWGEKEEEKCWITRRELIQKSPTRTN